MPPVSKRYRVFWATIAMADLAAIKEFIEQDDPVGATAIVEHIHGKAQTLVILPHRGRTVEELRSHGLTQYYELLASPWRIIYRIVAENVYVLAIIDGRQNVQNILFERFLRS